MSGYLALLRRLASSINRRIFRNDRLYTVGRHRLKLPWDCHLDVYQAKYKRYDWALGEIAREMFAKYPKSCAIDIGANVGDSAALICKHQDVPVLCIEGHPKFIAYLRENAASMPYITIVQCLIGKENAMIPISSLTAAHGTAHISGEGIPNSDGNVAMRKLPCVIHDYSKFSGAKLIKIDTDGSDFDVIQSSGSLFVKNQPGIFFEYDPTLRADGPEQSIDTIKALNGMGYPRFLVYDNFGNLMRLIREDAPEEFSWITEYLLANKRYGLQVYYVDVLALAEHDADICERVIAASRRRA
jgi:FkbM family methyltransferase